MRRPDRRQFLHLAAGAALLPAGIVRIPHVGLDSPTEGLTIDVRVAPPLVVNDPVDAYVNPAGSASVTLTCCAVPSSAPLDTVIV